MFLRFLKEDGRLRVVMAQSAPSLPWGLCPLPRGPLSAQPWAFGPCLSFALGYSPATSPASDPTSWTNLGLRLSPWLQPCLWRHPDWTLVLTLDPIHHLHLHGALSVNPALPTLFWSVETVCWTLRALPVWSWPWAPGSCPCRAFLLLLLPMLKQFVLETDLGFF